MGSLNPENEAKQELDDSGYVQEDGGVKTQPELADEMEDTSVNLLDLSDDVLLYILQYCEPLDLKALGYTCPRLGALVLDRTLWQRVDARGAPAGEARLRWLLAHALSDHTTSLRLSGHAREVEGCLGYMNGTSDGPLLQTQCCRADSEPWVRVEPYGTRLLRLCAQALPRDEAGFPYLPMQYDPEDMNEQVDKPPDGEKTSCPGPQITITQSALYRLVERCPNLTELALEYAVIDCNMTKISMFPPTLRILSLLGTKCFNIGKSYLYKIQDHLVHLESLDLSECSWVEPACMLPLSKLPRLKRLMLRLCPKLTEFVAYASLATRYGFKQLQHLDLRGSPVGDSEVSALGWVPRLRELHLAPAPRAPAPRPHAHLAPAAPPPAAARDLPWERDEPEYYSKKYESPVWIQGERKAKKKKRHDHAIYDPCGFLGPQNMARSGYENVQFGPRDLMSSIRAARLRRLYGENNASDSSRNADDEPAQGTSGQNTTDKGNGDKTDAKRKKLDDDDDSDSCNDSSSAKKSAIPVESAISVIEPIPLNEVLNSRNESSFMNEPMDPANEPKDPVNEPKDPVNEPKDLVNEPKDLVNDPKDPVNEPKDSVNEPKDPVNEPTEPENKPTMPLNKPKCSTDKPINHKGASGQDAGRDNKETSDKKEPKKRKHDDDDDNDSSRELATPIKLATSTNEPKIPTNEPTSETNEPTSETNESAHASQQVNSNKAGRSTMARNATNEPTDLTNKHSYSTNAPSCSRNAPSCSTNKTSRNKPSTNKPSSNKPLTNKSSRNKSPNANESDNSDGFSSDDNLNDLLNMDTLIEQNGPIPIRMRFIPSKEAYINFTKTDSDKNDSEDDSSEDDNHAPETKRSKIDEGANTSRAQDEGNSNANGESQNNERHRNRPLMRDPSDATLRFTEALNNMFNNLEDRALREADVANMQQPNQQNNNKNQQKPQRFVRFRMNQPPVYVEDPALPMYASQARPQDDGHEGCSHQHPVAMEGGSQRPVTMEGRSQPSVAMGGDKQPSVAVEGGSQSSGSIYASNQSPNAIVFNKPVIIKSNQSGNVEGSNRPIDYTVIKDSSSVNEQSDNKVIVIEGLEEGGNRSGNPPAAMESENRPIIIPGNAAVMEDDNRSVIIPGNPPVAMEGDNRPIIPGNLAVPMEGDNMPMIIPGNPPVAMEGDNRPIIIPGNPPLVMAGDNRPMIIPGNPPFAMEGHNRPMIIPGNPPVAMEGDNRPIIIPGYPPVAMEGHNRPWIIPGNPPLAMEGDNRRIIISGNPSVILERDNIARMMPGNPFVPVEGDAMNELPELRRFNDRLWNMEDMQERNNIRNNNVYNNNDVQQPDWNNRPMPVPGNGQGGHREAHPRHRVLYVSVGRRQHATYQVSLPPASQDNLTAAMNLLYSSHPTPRLDHASLVTDAAIRRFGRADNDNISYLQIGPNGPILAPHNDVHARPNRSNLRVLTVTGFRHISNASLTHLATAAPHLRVLDLRGTRVTEAGVEQFKHYRPDCEVKFGPEEDAD